jgi:hypothetical protein
MALVEFRGDGAASYRLAWSTDDHRTFQSAETCAERRSQDRHADIGGNASTAQSGDLQHAGGGLGTTPPSNKDSIEHTSHLQNYRAMRSGGSCIAFITARDGAEGLFVSRHAKDS